MNLILIKPMELRPDRTVMLDNRRSLHLIDTLGVRCGTRLKVGLVNGPKGVGTVLDIKNGKVTLAIEELETGPDEPPFDLVLALPRPIMLKRIFFHASSLGIARIFLIRSQRVEKSYFQASLLSPQEYLPVLELGLEQSADTWMPSVSIFQRFLPFAEDFLVAYDKASMRLLADPDAPHSLPEIVNFHSPPRVLLAVGPEGGWVDYELEVLKRAGFTPFSLGKRILRVETAIPVIIGQLQLLREFSRYPAPTPLGDISKDSRMI
jgi:RsmE family RNA methyltransferase